MIGKKNSSIRKALRVCRNLALDRRPNAAYVGGWLGKNNLGDEALFDAMRYLFPDFCFSEFDGGRFTSVLAQKFSVFPFGILGGGTLIGQNRLFLTTAEAFLKKCPNLYIFGTGVEDGFFWPNGTTLTEWLPILKRCRFVGVRGPISADLLINSGVGQVEIIGDPVIAFARNDINLSPVPQTIGLNIGTADGKLWGNEERICGEVVKLAKLAKKAGWLVKWFVIWPKDAAITKRAAQQSETEDEIHFIYNDPKAFMEKVRPLSVFVGMKLHATVLATCALTPSIMLEYRPKCLDYMSSIGQENSTFRTDVFRAEEIWEIVQQWNLNYHEVATTLSEGVSLVVKKQREFATDLNAEITTTLE